MAEITFNSSMPETEAEYETAIEHSLMEMKRLREQMNADQQEIDRLKVETQAILAELRTL